MSESLDHLLRITQSLASSDLWQPPVVPDPESVQPSVAAEPEPPPHPFESRNIHPDLPKKVRKLFDDGHCDNAVFEAFKYVEKEVKRISQIKKKIGNPLMMLAFNENDAKIALNALVTESETDEQLGYKHIFAGAMSGIRNPRGHEVDMDDTPDEALDYLALASLLLRKLDDAGVR